MHQPLQGQQSLTLKQCSAGSEVTMDPEVIKILLRSLSNRDLHMVIKLVTEVAEERLSEAAEKQRQPALDLDKPSHHI